MRRKRGGSEEEMRMVLGGDVEGMERRCEGIRRKRRICGACAQGMERICSGKEGEV